MLLNDLGMQWPSKDIFVKSTGNSQEADRKRVESRRNHVKTFGWDQPAIGRILVRE